MLLFPYRDSYTHTDIDIYMCVNVVVAGQIKRVVPAHKRQLASAEETNLHIFNIF